MACAHLPFPSGGHGIRSTRSSHPSSEGGIVLSLIVGWKLASVCPATISLVAGFGWVRLATLTSFAEKMKKTHQDSATYASEAASAIRTVASLTMGKRVLQHYDSILMRQSRALIISILQASALYAASMSVTMLCCALAFWHGGNLLASREYTVLQFFICFAALISGAQTAGVVFSYAPGMSRAFSASRDLRTLFDRRPEIDSWSVAGKHMNKETCVGSIQFRNVILVIHLGRTKSSSTASACRFNLASSLHWLARVAAEKALWWVCSSASLS